MDEESSDSEPDFPEYGMHCVSVGQSDQILATVEINESKLQMEIDTGAPRSIVGEGTFKQLWPEEQRPSLSPAKLKLRTYTGELIPVHVSGVAMVNGNYHHQCKVLELLVAEGAKPTLIGHDWLHDLKLLELQKSMTNKIMHCYNAGGPVSYIVTFQELSTILRV